MKEGETKKNLSGEQIETRERRLRLPRGSRGDPPCPVREERGKSDGLSDLLRERQEAKKGRVKEKEKKKREKVIGKAKKNKKIGLCSQDRGDSSSQDWSTSCGHLQSILLLLRLLRHYGVQTPQLEEHVSSVALLLLLFLLPFAFPFLLRDDLLSQLRQQTRKTYAAEEDFEDLPRGFRSSSSRLGRPDTLLLLVLVFRLLLLLLRNSRYLPLLEKFCSRSAERGGKTTRPCRGPASSSSSPERALPA